MIGQYLAKPTNTLDRIKRDGENAIETCNLNDPYTHSLCKPGYYILKISYSNPELPVELASQVNDKGYLYYCDGNECINDYYRGYFKNADEQHNNVIPYIVCNTEKYSNEGYWEENGYNGPCIAVGPAKDKNTCDSEDEFINITNEQTSEVQVCLGENGPSMPFREHDPIFYKNNENYKYIFVSDENSVHIEKNKHYFVDANDIATAKPGMNGTTYLCNNSFCEKSDYIGYIYNAIYAFTPLKDDLVPYIQCKYNENHEIICTTIETVTNDKCSASGTNAAKDGELFLTTENIGTEEHPENKTFYNLCLDTSVVPSVSIKLNEKETTTYLRYFLSLNNENNIFGHKNNIYCIIELTDRNIILSDSGEIMRGILYIYSKGDYKVFENNDTCEANDDPFTFIEFGSIPTTDEDFVDGQTYFRKIPL